MTESPPPVLELPPSPELVDPSTRFRLRELLLWLPLAAAVYFPALGLTLGWHVLRSREWGLALGSLWFYATTLGWMAWTVRRNHLSWRRLMGGAPRGSQWFDCAAAPALHLMFSAAVITLALGLLARFAPAWVERLTAAERGGFEMGRTPPLTQWLLIAVLAPITEELFFRGILLHRACRRWGVTPGLVWVSLLFGSLHVNPVGITAFGLLVGVLYLRSGSLWASSLAHSLNNTLPLLLTFGASHTGTADATPGVATLARALPAASIATLGTAGLITLTLVTRWPRGLRPMPWVAPAA